MLQADDKLSIAPSFESTFSLVLVLLPHVCVFLPLSLLLYVCVLQATNVEHTGWPGGDAAPDGRKEDACTGKDGAKVCASA
jgi:hypothetical protein